VAEDSDCRSKRSPGFKKLHCRFGGWCVGNAAPRYGNVYSSLSATLGSVRTQKRTIATFIQKYDGLSFASVCVEEGKVFAS